MVGTSTLAKTERGLQKPRYKSDLGILQYSRPGEFRDLNTIQADRTFAHDSDREVGWVPAHA
jgi:hypothetical protein